MSYSALKSIGIGDRDCDPTSVHGTVITFGILSEFVYRLSVSPGPLFTFFPFQQEHC